MNIYNIKITPFQRQILYVLPAGNKGVKKQVRKLSFFVVRKQLKIESLRSIKNLISSIKCLEYKGLLKREGEDIEITEEGIRFKENFKTEIGN
jgi:hypothetical protein